MFLSRVNFLEQNVYVVLKTSVSINFAAHINVSCSLCLLTLWEWVYSWEMADLRGANLSNADLRKANMRRAKLFRVDLQGADLSEAQLFRANLRAANLTGAKYNIGTIRRKGFDPIAAGAVLLED